MLGLGILAAALALKRVSDEIAYRATTDERRLQLHVSRAGRDDLTKPEGPVVCHVEEHAEYEGEQISWGFETHTKQVQECSRKCTKDPRCNAWSWCAAAAGCGGRNHPRGTCWTKRLTHPDLSSIMGRRGADVPYTSGVCYPANRRWSTEAAIQHWIDAEEARIAGLLADDTLPLVFADVEIKGEPVGRMLFVLFTNVAPRAAENFRLFFTGEKGIVPPGRLGAGYPYGLNGTVWHRVYDRFISQGGANTESPLPEGGYFKDDPGSLKLQHDRKGLLSVANRGPNTNAGHFR